jgi:hypothetical protein
VEKSVVKNLVTLSLYNTREKAFQQRPESTETVLSFYRGLTSWERGRERETSSVNIIRS